MKLSSITLVVRRFVPAPLRRVVLTKEPFNVKPLETRLLCEPSSEDGVIRTMAYTF